MKHAKSNHEKVYFHRAHALPRGNMITGLNRHAIQPKGNGIMEKLKNEYNEKFIISQ